MPIHKPKLTYRIEERNINNKPMYYLVKDVKINGEKIKIQKYLGRTKPTEEELQHLTQKYAYEIENKAIQKKATLTSKKLKTKYLDQKTVETLELIRYFHKKFKQLLTANEVAIYEQNFETNYVHGTTAIEGNTLTKQQTYDLLVNELLPHNKKLREINEIQNFIKVKQYRDQYTERVNLKFIQTLHSLIMNNIDYQTAGSFRRIDALMISGCDLALTPAELVAEELTTTINDYYTAIDKGHCPFEEAVLFHYRFEIIHPFTDGNGRVGRELLNYLLHRNGYPKMLILNSDRTNYIQMLKLGDEEKYQEMVIKFAQLIISQRLEALMNNLAKVITPPKTGQLRIHDFFF
jgi:Fic family protein